MCAGDGAQYLIVLVAQRDQVIARQAAEIIIPKQSIDVLTRLPAMRTRIARCS
jgi:hypothetical protein